MKDVANGLNANDDAQFNLIDEPIDMDELIQEEPTTHYNDSNTKSSESLNEQDEGDNEENDDDSEDDDESENDKDSDGDDQNNDDDGDELNMEVNPEVEEPVVEQVVEPSVEQKVLHTEADDLEIIMKKILVNSWK